MGNEESRSRASEERPAYQYRERPAPQYRAPQPQPQPSNQFSEAEVARLLEAQKQHFDKKVEEIIKSQTSTPPQITTQNVAGSSNSQANLAGKQTTRPSPVTTTPKTPTGAGSSSLHGSTNPQANLAGKQTAMTNPFSPNAILTYQTQSVAGRSSAQATSFDKSANSPSTSGTVTPNQQRGPSPVIMSSTKQVAMNSIQSQAHSVAGSSSAQGTSFVKSSNTPSTSSVVTPNQQRGPSPVIISSMTVERTRAPYNYSQSQLNQATGQTLYPNLNTLQAQNNTCASTSDFVFVNKSGNAERQVPVPSAPPAPRDRSTSRTRSRNDDEDQVKCPTCKRLYGLTIFQCPSGHSSCSECKKARRVCGLCYRPIGDMRNIMLEEFVSEMKVKCPNTEDGCHLFIKLADMQNHVRECPFRELPCPLTSISGCLWKGKLAQVANHFDSVHPMNRQAAVDTEMSHMNIQNNCHVAHLVVLGAFNFIFHLIVSKTEEKVYMAVQLIGTNISASKWTYDIHVYHKGQPRRKYQYADVCTPVNTNISDIMSVSKCAVLPLSYASTFLCDNKLTFKFFIKKEYEKPFGYRGRGRGRGGHRKGQ